ncbi:4205_t:CDS:1 [Dentiscutata heterogama]|uniref:4205_t:CDS:1 n=1 Tax=Dentiscutata heterogama TaxID=1316150 RepID=A0ACA9KUS8_9GLOM|nr:4205_t:CDS:1 [Dentiscutata heterogama]
MNKDKSHKDTFYWYCEKQDIFNCSGCAVMKLIDNRHYLKNALDHNCVAETSQSVVVKMIARIKEQIQKTNDRLAQIVQIAITNTSQYVYPYLPLSKLIDKLFKGLGTLTFPQS